MSRISLQKHIFKEKYAKKIFKKEILKIFHKNY